MVKAATPIIIDDGIDAGSWDLADAALFDKRKKRIELTVILWPVFAICLFYYSILRLPKIKEWIDANDPGAQLIPLSGVFEHKLMDMPEDEKQRFCEENKIAR